MSNDIRNQGIDPFLRIETGTVDEFVRYKKFGRASDAVINVWNTIWDGNNDYPYPIANLINPTIVSTDADDDQEIMIEGVDEDFKYVKEIIALNGLTPVALIKTIMLPFRIENMGTTSLEGTVALSVGITDYAIITNSGSEYNKSQMAIMAIPAGWYGLVTKVGASLAANNSGEINFRSKCFNEPWKVQRPLDITEQVIPEVVNFFFNEKTILDVRVKPESNNTPASAWFDIVLVKKERFHQIWGLPNRTQLR